MQSRIPSLYPTRRKIINSLELEIQSIESKIAKAKNNEKNLLMKERREVQKDLDFEIKEAMWHPKVIYSLSDLGWSITFESAYFDPAHNTHHHEIFDFGIPILLTRMKGKGKGMFRYEIQEEVFPSERDLSPARRLERILSWLTEGKEYRIELANSCGWFEGLIVNELNELKRLDSLAYCEDRLHRERILRRRIKEAREGKVEMPPPVLEKNSISELHIYDLEKRSETASDLIVSAVKNYWCVGSPKYYPPEYVIKKSDPFNFILSPPIYGDKLYIKNSDAYSQTKVYIGKEEIDFSEAFPIIDKQGNLVVEKKIKKAQDFRKQVGNE